MACGRIEYEDGLGDDSEVLSYRLSMTRLATEIKDYLGLSIKDAYLFDVWVWKKNILERMHRNNSTKEKKYNGNITRALSQWSVKHVSLIHQSEGKVSTSLNPRNI